MITSKKINNKSIEIQTKFNNTKEIMTINAKLLALTFLIISNLLFAQSSYISINGGYGWAASSGNIKGIENATYTSSSSTDLTPVNEEQINLSFGQGTSFGLSAGYMYNANIGAEIGISLLKGDNINSKSTVAGNAFIINLNNDISAEMMRISPSIIINAGMAQLNPYLKIGVIFGSGDITKKTSVLEGTHSYETSYRFNGGWAIGTTANFGVLYTLEKDISCFVELAMVNMSYAPTNGELTAKVENGVSILPSMTVNDRKIEYKDSYTSLGQNSSTSTPSVGLSQKFPFGSVGLNLGIKYNLQ